MYGMINYYRIADNFYSVKSLIEGLRKSCVLTLARKHKKRPKWVYGVYGYNISITLPQGGALPTMESVGKLEPKFGLGQEAGLDLDKILSKFQSRSTLGAFSRCAVRTKTSPPKLARKRATHSVWGVGRTMTLRWARFARLHTRPWRHPTSTGRAAKRLTALRRRRGDAPNGKTETITFVEDGPIQQTYMSNTLKNNITKSKVECTTSISTNFKLRRRRPSP